MTLKEFMMLFCKTHLSNHWQDDMRITLSHMHQDTSCFWEFQQAVQTTNTLLKGTPHHLNDKKLCECIEARMDQVLYMQSTNAKYNKIVKPHDWLSEVKSLNDKKCFECLQAIKASNRVLPLPVPSHMPIPTTNLRIVSSLAPPAKPTLAPLPLPLPILLPNPTIPLNSLKRKKLSFSNMTAA
jgi:hypothetical protein